jgi:S-DNA-T family DNA segregation ATPase FtsK/SpoIIIE
MNSAQKAVISAAKKEGLSPMEIASELMNHDITEVVLGFMRKREVAFNKLSEQEQDSVIAELGSELKKITATACRVINANGVETVGATLKALKIDGKLTATMIIDGDEPNRHVLTDKAHDKSSILIVLYPNSYSEGMSAHVGEKDQKALPLDDEPAEQTGKKPKAGKAAPAKTAKKEIEIPPKLLTDARDFVTIQQNASIAGLQNHLKIGYEKADAILKALEGEGLVVWVGTEETGQYELVRAKPAYDAATMERFYAEACKAVIKAASADDAVMRDIYGDDDNAIEVALMRMEDDGIVSPPSPEGLRDVLTLPQA